MPPSVLKRVVNLTSLLFLWRFTTRTASFMPPSRPFSRPTSLQPRHPSLSTPLQSDVCFTRTTTAAAIVAGRHRKYHAAASVDSGPRRSGASPASFCVTAAAAAAAGTDETDTMASESDMPELKVVTVDQVPTVKADPVDPVAREQAKAIVDDVESGGTKSLVAQALRLGDIKSESDPLVLGPAEMKAAFDELPEEDRQVLVRTKDRVEIFAKAQRAALTDASVPIPGGMAGHTVSPMSVAGCYAPGGRYPLPSSVIMTAVTARAAGVPKVIVASPRPAAATVAAAHVSGADALLCVGGAQAVAAMAFGVGGVPPCDIIVGPGNNWVTAAKSLVSGRCAIDMLAGPSEVLVIADSTADVETVAADLLAQAEHDTEARPILVSTSESLVAEVNACVKKRLAVLPTRDTALEAVKKGFAVVCKDVAEAVAVSDLVAPEHLEIQTEDSQKVADSCLHYGGLFIGRRAAEVLGDYGAGPNHVLPTGGTARYTGGLSVMTFLRVRTWMRIDEAQSSQALVRDAVHLARMEGLEGHARAAECRLD
ncbi:unnamed protein product [Ectocarpus sp. 12 AP-2014]